MAVGTVYTNDRRTAEVRMIGWLGDQEPNQSYGHREKADGSLEYVVWEKGRWVPPKRDAD